VSTRELFNVRAPLDALGLLLARLDARVAAEEIATWDALDRVLAEDVRSPADLPAFRRSTMDGFAVRAADTFGASEGLPAYLELVDEVLMGRASTGSVALGECAQIATGGMLPNGTDAVIMVEHTQAVGATTVEALRPVAPGENVVQVAEDVRTDDPILLRGHALRPQDLGGLLALGVVSVRVGRRLRVGIVSGGDELSIRARRRVQARFATSTRTRLPPRYADLVTSRGWSASSPTSTPFCNRLPTTHWSSATC